MQALLKKGQSKHLCFLESNTPWEEIGKQICALLNSGGGQIIVGLTEDGRPTESHSIKQVESRLKKLLGDSEHPPLLTPDAIWDICEETVEGANIVILDIPSGADLPYVFEDTIYIRAGKQTRIATGSEVRALIDKRYQQGERWERQPALQVKLDDLDEAEIFKTVEVASQRRGWHFPNTGNIEAILKDLNLFHDGGLTHAAVILFAKEAGHILPQSHLRMTAFRTDTGDKDFLEDKEVRGHLFSHLEAYDAFLQRHISVRTELNSQTVQRIDRPQYPYWALREGFRNALLHRDYSSIHGRTSVRLFPQKMDIWNMGLLPSGLTFNKLTKENRSIPVNPDIARVVFLRGIVDLLGRGVSKIVNDFTSYGMPAPTWKKEAGGITLELRSIGKSDEEASPLNQRQIELTRSMIPGKNVTSAEYQKKHTDVSERTIRNDLSELVKLGYFSKSGKGKSTQYVRTEKTSI